MAEYQGHSSKAAWNVALWVANDESLYRLALECKRLHPNNLRRAAIRFQTMIGGEGAKTPDGYAYSLRSIHEALEGLE